MNASVLPNAFLDNKGKNSIKTIESISLMLDADKLDPFPFLFSTAFSLYLIFKLTLINKKINKLSNEVKRVIKNIPYEQARDSYIKLSKFNKTNKPLYNPTHNKLERVSDRLFFKTLSMLVELEETYSSVLFYKIDPTIQLTEKEKDVLASFNEIWGDDDDEVYARDTHRRLTEAI